MRSWCCSRFPRCPPLPQQAENPALLGTSGFAAYTLEMSLQLGEPLQDKQSLGGRGGSQFFVLENPGIVVRDKDSM